MGGQLDAQRLGRSLFGDSAVLARLIGRLTNVDVSYGRSYSSTYFGAPLVPGLGYQLALGGFDSFRRQGDRLAGSAADNLTLNAAGGVQLWLGLRATGNYQHTHGETWVKRGSNQVPLETDSREWPSGTASWSLGNLASTEPSA